MTALLDIPASGALQFRTSSSQCFDCSCKHFCMRCSSNKVPALKNTVWQVSCGCLMSGAGCRWIRAGCNPDRRGSRRHSHSDGWNSCQEGLPEADGSSCGSRFPQHRLLWAACLRAIGQEATSRTQLPHVPRCGLPSLCWMVFTALCFTSRLPLLHLKCRAFQPSPVQQHRPNPALEHCAH